MNNTDLEDCDAIKIIWQTDSDMENNEPLSNMKTIFYVVKYIHFRIFGKMMI